MCRRILYSGSLSWSPQWCRLSPNLANARNKNKLNSLTHFWALGFLEFSYLIWREVPRATTSSMTRKRLATSFMTKAEVKSIRQFALDWKCIGARDLDLAIFLRVVLECRCNIKHQLMLETSYLVMETHANLTPVQTRATCTCLPNGKAKKHGHCQKSCQSFGKLFGKGRLFGRPFFKTNPQELSTLCIYPIKRLNNTKNVSINKILSITNFAHDFYPAT